MIPSPRLLFSSGLKVWSFIAICLLLNGLLRILLKPHAVWIDEAEQVYLAQWLEAGSLDAQPPLYTWIHHFAFALTGPNAWFVVFFKVAILCLAYYGMYKTFSLLRPGHPVAIASGLLSFVFLIDLWDETPFRTNTILVLCAVVWSLVFFVRIALYGKRIDYFLFGLACSIGFLAKYIFILPVCAMLMAGLSLPVLRRKLLSPAMALALAGFLLMSLPHIWWVLERLSQINTNLQAEIGNLHHETYARSVWHGMLSFGTVLFSFAGIWVIIMMLFFRKTWIHYKRAGNDGWSTFFLRYLLFLFLLFIFSIFIFKVTVFHSRYLVPCFIVLPVYVFLRTTPRIPGSQKHEYWFQWLGASVLIITLLFNTVPIGIRPFYGKTGYMDLPYDRIAEAINHSYQDIDMVIVNDIGFAGNMKLNLGNDHTVLLFSDHDHMEKAKGTHAQHTALYVWPVEGVHVAEMLESLRIRYPLFREDEIVYTGFPYHVPAGKSCRVGMWRVERNHIQLNRN